MERMTADRTLIVMRHAAAGDLPGGPDVERALRPQGRQDAAAAGRWLAGRGIRPDRVLCSPARRARQTWQHVGAELAAAPEVIGEARLYRAGARELLEIIGWQADQARSLLCLGHNPAAAGVTELLIGRPVEFPAAGIAIIDVKVPWPDLITGAGDGAGDLIASWTPGQVP
jgi:phosphohistidine phosphatase